ncbi:MAG: M56 family metallopeptidase [Lachnospiraceae bacterium]|nr:M56 family metallopeptidase [Lachnospiraceae bacterium]
MILIKVSISMALLCIIWGLIRGTMQKAFSYQDKYNMDRVCIIASFLLLPAMVIGHMFPVYYKAAPVVAVTEYTSAFRPTFDFSILERGIMVARMVGLGIFVIFLLRYLFRSHIFKVAVPLSETGMFHNESVVHEMEQGHILLCDQVLVPITWGILHPRTLLPYHLLKDLDEDGRKQLEQIILHEMIHMKRRDNLVKSLALLTLCVNWYQPLMWMMYFYFLQDVEMSCDERVIHYIGLNNRESYMDTLLHCAKKHVNMKNMISQMAAGKLKKRLGVIMRMKEFGRKRMVRNKIIAGAVTLTACIVLCSTIVIFAAQTEYVGNPPVDIQEKPAPTAMQEEAQAKENYAAMTTEELEALVKNPDANLDTMIEQGRLTEEQAAEALHTYNRRLAGEGTDDYAAMTTEELEALVKNPDANLDTMIEQGRLTEEQAAEALHTYNRRLFGE